MTKRAALYLRVSTDRQTVENQRADLVKLAELRQWTVVQTYQDAGISGAKGRDKRPGLDNLMKDAKQRRFDIAAFWAVDRLGRSAALTATTMQELDDLGVEQFYFKESMDTSTTHGRAMLSMAAVFARLERDLIVERVKAGVERVKRDEADPMRQAARRRDGKGAIGRPSVGNDKEAAIREWLARDPRPGLIKIAGEVGVGVGTVQRVQRQDAIRAARGRDPQPALAEVAAEFRVKPDEVARLWR